jgi:hypothetical protein
MEQVSAVLLVMRASSADNLVVEIWVVDLEEAQLTREVIK